MTQWMSGASIPWRAAKAPPMALRQPGLLESGTPGARSVGDDVYTTTTPNCYVYYWDNHVRNMVEISVVYGCLWLFMVVSHIGG